MQTEMATVIRYKEEVDAFFNSLIDILLEENYFSFIESAFDYVFNMKNYIEKYIAVLPNYIAPDYFDKYQKGMRYMTYQANKRTTWYIFFKQKGNRFIIYYITNNHFEGQYIR